MHSSKNASNNRADDRVWYALNVALPYFTRLYRAAIYPKMLLAYNIGAFLALAAQVALEAAVLEAAASTVYLVGEVPPQVSYVSQYLLGAFERRAEGGGEGVVSTMYMAWGG